MRKFRDTCAVVLASTSMLAIASQSALAQDSEEEEEIEIEEVITTGTYIRGRSQSNSASPITVVGVEKLRNIGAANFADLTQTLTINNGAQNNPDAFTQNGTTGTESINLRGLGVSSTLVLLNGRRQTYSGSLTNDAVNFVDTAALIPQIATRRVEILKDGAAALYGSDAVAGVVNFITDDDFEGISTRVRYGTLTDQGSSEDFLAEAKLGWSTDNFSIMGAFSYYDRTELTTQERRLSRSFDDTSALGNPGAFFLFGSLPVIDPTGCSEQGGFPIPNAGAQAALDANNLPFTGGFCGFDFGDFFSLVPDTERVNAYVTASYEFAEGHELRTEFAFAEMDAVRGNSPTFPFLQLGSAAVPANHPNNVFPEALGPVLFFGRAIGNGGEVSPGFFESVTRRFNISASGPLGDDWNYDASFSYSRNNFRSSIEDVITNRFSQALQGFGGNSCSGTVPGENGCLFFNPFATSFTTAPNSQEVLDFVRGRRQERNEAELAVFDAVVSGSLFDLPAGEVGLAVGFQYRDEGFSADYNPLTNQDAFAFVIGAPDFEDDRDIYAFFAETAVPLTEDLELTVAARFEDYGGVIGDTLDPKVSLRWSATDNITLRGSYGTAFRAPSIFQQRGRSTSLNQVTDPISNQNFFAAVRNLEAPADGRPITPEQSEAFNLGFTYDNSGFNFNLDYWNFSFSDVIIQENFQAVVDADPNSTTRIQRAAGPGSPILFVFVDFVNASAVDTSGIDLSMSYDIELGDGVLTPGFDATWVLEYDIDDPQAGQVDGAGNRNFTNFGSPTPEIRFNASLQYSDDLQSINIFGRYIDGLNDDQVLGGLAAATVAPDQIVNRAIGSQFTVDAQYNLNLGFIDPSLENSAFTIGVINAFDSAPPQVLTNGGFESRTHDPRGRVLYFELSTRF